MRNQRRKRNIRYFPLDYIKEHIEEFSEERDYYFISLRLAMDKNYVINRCKLSDIDYLSVLYHTNRQISDEDPKEKQVAKTTNYC